MGTGRGSTSSQASVASAGYSGTPLAAKLGIKAGDRVALVGAPDGYRAWLGELPVGVSEAAVGMEEGPEPALTILIAMVLLGAGWQLWRRRTSAALRAKAAA